MRSIKQIIREMISDFSKWRIQPRVEQVQNNKKASIIFYDKDELVVL